jgi:hypothetical protein
MLSNDIIRYLLQSRTIPLFVSCARMPVDGEEIRRSLANAVEDLYDIESLL